MQNLSTNPTSNDLVSVIVSAYNHEKYVQQMLRSLIDQTYQNIELIITNDGSNDDTHRKIKAMLPECEAHFRRVDYTDKSNEGRVKSFNLCLSKARGEYVYIIASDDMAEPKAIETLHAFLVANRSYGLAVGDNIFIDHSGKRCYWTKKQAPVYSEDEAYALTFAAFLKKLRPDIDFSSESFGSYKELLSGNHIPNGYLIRKTLIDEVGGYSEDAPLEDLYLMLQLSKKTRFKFIDTPLFRYRWHESNTIKQRDQMEKIQAQTLKLETDYARERGLLDFLIRKKSIRFLRIRIYERKQGRGILTVRVLNLRVMRRITKNNTQTIYVLGIPVMRKAICLDNPQYRT